MYFFVSAIFLFQLYKNKMYLKQKIVTVVIFKIIKKIGLVVVPFFFFYTTVFIL
jgi:hypothetical protein